MYPLQKLTKCLVVLNSKMINLIYLLKKLSSVLLIVLFLVQVNHAQTLKNSREFVVKTPFVESDGRIVSQVENNIAYLLGKSKGGNAQYSQYFLQAYDKNLGLIWSVKKEFEEEDQVLGIQLLNDKVVLFWVSHDLKKKSKTVTAQAFSKSSGDISKEIEMIVQGVGEWKIVPNKGMSASGLENVINSGNRKDLVTPLEYQFKLRTSPDKSKVLLYSYDYSKQDLYLDLNIFDASLTQINEARIPVNKGFIHQENLINNRGEVFMINRRETGLIAVVHYKIDEKKSNYLEIDASNTLRGSFYSQLVKDDHLWVAHVNTRDTQLAGVSYSEFDFKEDKVGKIMYHPMGDEFKAKIASLDDNKNEIMDEDWSNFQIIDFQILSNGGKSIIIEQQNYQSRGYFYNPEAGNDISQWTGERLGELSVGNAFILRFDSNDNFQWDYPLLKAQKGNAHEGLNIIGLKSSISSEGDVKMVYELFGRGHHSINYVNVDGKKGNILKNKVLENPEKLNVLLPFTTWFSDAFILVGKKGFSGKSSTLLLYQN